DLWSLEPDRSGAGEDGRARPHDRHLVAGWGRVRVAKRLADVTDLRWRVLAGARDPAVRALGGQWPAVRTTAGGAAVDPDARLRRGRVADGFRDAVGGEHLAGGAGALRLRPAVRC